MTVKTTREIVVEIERVRRVRKRCRTHVSFCAECGREVDFISLGDAAELFEVDSGLLDSCILQRLCHNIPSSDKETLLCLPSLLNGIKKKTADPKSKDFSIAPLRLLPD